jgi:energy-coupling factor transport system permease protein
MRKLSYQEGQTIIHCLYPLTKLCWLVLGTIFTFLLTNGYLLLIVSSVLLIVLIVINRDIWKVRGFRLVIATGLILFTLYLIFDKSGSIVINPGIPLLRITSVGLNTGLRFSGRFFSIVFLSYIFILTTDPNQLAYSLMKVGLPYRYGFMLVTALRLAPILEKEAQTIYRAQLVRGVQYNGKNFKKIFLLMQQFLTPLLISAIRRADKLVFSMEGRGFGRHKERTFRSQTSPTSLDMGVSVSLSIFFGMLILINYGVLT